MKRWLIGLVVIASAGCGSDNPVEPADSTHSIRLDVLWPLAAHPAISDAQFFYGIGFGCNLSEDACANSFVSDFDSQGKVQVQFYDRCVPGELRSSNVSVGGGTGVSAFNTVTSSDCVLPVSWVCQNGLQDVLIDAPEENADPACEVPTD